MSRINFLHYVLLGMPVVLFFLSLILVMGQGKKDFIGMIKRGAGRMKRKLALVLVLSLLYGAAWIGQEQLQGAMQSTPFSATSKRIAEPVGARFDFTCTKYLSAGASLFGVCVIARMLLAAPAMSIEPLVR